MLEEEVYDTPPDDGPPPRPLETPGQLPRLPSNVRTLNSFHGKPMPDSGISFEIKLLDTFSRVPSSFMAAQPCSDLVRSFVEMHVFVSRKLLRLLTELRQAVEFYGSDNLVMSSSKFGFSTHS